MRKLFTILSLLIFLLFTSCTKKEYFIQFDADGGKMTSGQALVITNGKNLILPTPEKEYYDFSGWYSTKNGVEIKVSEGKFKDSLFDTNGDKIQFVAKYVPKNITINVQLEYNNSKYQDKVEKVKFGNHIDFLSKIEGDEYREFTGWYTQYNGNEVLVYDGKKYIDERNLLTEKNYEINSNSITIYAKFIDKEFNCKVNIDGKSSEFTNLSYSAKYGSTLKALPTPTKTNSEFEGWYTLVDGKEVLVHDGIIFKRGMEVLNQENYQIVEDTVTIYAKYTSKKYRVTFIYDLGGIENTDIVEVPHGESVVDYSPKSKNEYNEEITYSWGTNRNGNIENEFTRVYQDVTLYALGYVTTYNKIYRSIISIDGSQILIDFKTTNKTNINSKYVSSSGVKRIVFVGNPQKAYTNFSVVVSATGYDVELKLIDFKYQASSGEIGLDASGISNNRKLILNAEGNSSITGGSGIDGKKGTSYDVNNSTKTPHSGQPGTNGTNGRPALIGNNVEINVDVSGALYLIGGAGGSGGAGGNGEGSASDGIAQAGHGAAGGQGGNGGNGLEVAYALTLNSHGNLFATGGNGGSGGVGGNGGHNQDTGITDRADNGGHGANGGAGGSGGIGILISESATFVSIKNNTITATGGSGGAGGRGGSGGNGGNGGNSVQGQNINVIKIGGQGGSGAYPGTPGSGNGTGKKGNQGTNGQNGQ